MPTISNPTNESVPYTDKNGNIQTAKPGETGIETWFFPTDARLTVTSPEPYFPRTPGTQKVDAAADPGKTHPISPDCDVIRLLQIQGEITVYANEISISQVLVRSYKYEDVVESHACYGTIKQLILIGSGSCVVKQIRRIPGTR